MRFSTLAVHAGQGPDPRTGAVNVPVHLSSTFVQDGPGHKRLGFDYSRHGNPSRLAVEATLAALEGADYGLAFSSGQAACSATLDLLEPGDQMVTLPDVYNGSRRLFDRMALRCGGGLAVAHETSAEAVAAAVTSKTALVWVETPTNPLLNILDIFELAERLAKFKNHRGERPVLVVDNTFASPAFQLPLALGADIVSHSGSKYLGGHSDLIAGALLTKRKGLWERLASNQRIDGTGLAPMDCYLLQRGIRTLPLRMRQHQRNAFAVAEFLKGHPGVETVLFPGLPEHPGHAIAKRQMTGFPGMVSFRLKADLEGTRAMVARLRLIMTAESLGGVESLVCQPACMSHAGVRAAERRAAGITDDLVRLSLGIEDPEDLVDDLRSALNGA